MIPRRIDRVDSERGGITYFKKEGLVTFGTTRVSLFVAETKSMNKN